NHEHDRCLRSAAAARPRRKVLRVLEHAARTALRGEAAMTRIGVAVAFLFCGWLHAGAAAAAIELRAFDAASAEAIAQAHAGRPYVLAFWSIHCAPCLEDMKDWRALAQKYPNVSIILVTTDPPKERAKVQAVLARYQLDRGQNWAFADEFSERVRYAV